MYIRPSGFQRNFVRTKTRGGRAGVPKFASPSPVSTAQSLHFFNQEHELLPSSKDANPKKTKSQNVDSSKKLSPPKGAKPEKIAQARNEKSTAFKKSTQDFGENCTNLTFASEKRRRLHWTADEEEMPKEGVEKFSTEVNKNLPWKQVLEFGCHVFDPTRTPSDLKDKWRNIMAKESSAISRR
ncbi:hypothetical protein WN944_004192 [Citrus x changshan-huyou]|uniref:Myb-like domain-containing protein n=1 Tax=Citrus x changshan-huyou TaxID=2935761 RepID=A0AAP0LZY3_9ROSI